MDHGGPCSRGTKAEPGASSRRKPAIVWQQAASALAEARTAGELQKTAAAKDVQIQGLTARLAAIEVAQTLAVTRAVSAVEKECDELKNGSKQAELQKQLAESALKDRYEAQLKDRQD